MDYVYVLEGYYGYWGELAIYDNKGSAEDALDALNRRYGTAILRRVRTVELYS